MYYAGIRIDRCIKVYFTVSSPEYMYLEAIHMYRMYPDVSWTYYGLGPRYIRNTHPTHGILRSTIHVSCLSWRYICDTWRYMYPHTIHPRYNVSCPCRLGYVSSTAIHLRYNVSCPWRLRYVGYVLDTSYSDLPCPDTAQIHVLCAYLTLPCGCEG